MKIFISYSFNDNNLNLIPLLFNILKNNNIDVITSDTNIFKIENNISAIVQNQIRSAHLFIGILTKNGKQKKYVLNEFNIALKNRIPHLLLVESGMRIKTNQKINVIFFNLNNLDKTIDLIKRKRNEIAHSIKQTNDNSLAWLIGASTLLIIINSMMKDNK